MDLRPDHTKTINRLVGQRKFHTLKNLLRTWILNRDINVDDLLTACRTGQVRMPHAVLNRLGLLFGQGKEGIKEDISTAFKFYEVAAQLGNASANGNCAKYLYEGKVVGQPELNLAFDFCLRSIELGGDKYMLMAEILHEKQNYQQSVGFARRIIDDLVEYSPRQKERAAHIERQCFRNQLDLVFQTVKHPFSTANTLEQGESETKIVSMLSQLDISKQQAVESPDPTYRGVQFPGWIYISNEMDGFDKNECSKLTTKASLVELETAATKSAMEVAQKQIDRAKEDGRSEEIIEVLTSKVREFEEVHKTLEASRKRIEESWSEYTDVTEHILRRQVFAEQIFFDPQRTHSIPTYELSRDLLDRRLAGFVHADGAGAGAGVVELYPAFQLLDDSSNRMLPARGMLMAERGIIDASVHIFSYQTALYNGISRGMSSSWSMSFGPGTYDSTGIFSPRAGGTGGFGGDASISLRSNPGSPMSRTGAGSFSPSPSNRRDDSNPLEHSFSSPLSPTRQFLSPQQQQFGATSATASSEMFLQPSCLKEYTFLESIKIGCAVVQYKQTISPRTRHLGKYMYENPDSFNSEMILQQIGTVTLSTAENICVEMEQRMGQIMLQFAHDGKPVELHELRALNDAVTIEDVSNLNRIFYHVFVLQLVDWVLPHRSNGVRISPASDEDVNGDLPIATALARSVQLLIRGYLSISEMFSQLSQYRVLPLAPLRQMGKATFQQLKDNIIRINCLYDRAILQQRNGNKAAFVQFWKQHAGGQGEALPTIYEVNRELRELYGGETFTENDAQYETDNPFIQRLHSRLLKL